MKRHLAIGLLLLLALAACQGRYDDPVETQNLASLQPIMSEELQAVDSLLWQRPDSALALLLPWFDTVDSNETFDNHYAHLLLAELLYKNDYAQTNREALLAAVAYFDSLVRQAPPLKGGWGDSRHALNQKGNPAFLSARAHYINGVGYYEQDSVVEACREYIRALEIMESHFDEKDLVGEKARFMALAYTHLTQLFSDQYLSEQAICFGKLAIVYYQKYNATPWHMSWMLYEIGAQYEMNGIFDSADYYYQKGEKILPDTNNLAYRDLDSRLAFLSYVLSHSYENSLVRLKTLLVRAESEKEYFSRCLSIGEIYYHEKQYDSALVYLGKVYNDSQSVGAKKQAAEWLIEICKEQGKDNEVIDYANFLVPYANMSENQSHLKSQLTEQYHNYEQEKYENRYRKQLRRISKLIVVVLVSLAFLSSIVLVIHFVQRRKHKCLKLQKEAAEKQLESERYSHEMQQKALSGKLIRSNEALRVQKEEQKKLLLELQARQKQKDWSRLDDFMDEDICKEILALLQGKEIKREAKRDDYPELHLGTSQLSRLDMAVEKHFNGFRKTLADIFPKISSDEMSQCQLYLLNLEDVQIAHLLACDYSTVKKRSVKLKKAFGTEKELLLYIREYVL